MTDESTAANPPRILGILLLALGLALAGGGLQLNSDAAGGGSYFVTVGLLLAVSGGLVSAGRSVAVPVYALTLAVVWGWSLKETGGHLPELLPRVVLPSVIGLYFFSSRVRSRLA